MGNAVVRYSLGIYESEVNQEIVSARRQRVGERIWVGDHTLWSSNPEHVINRLGWLGAPAETLNKLSYLSGIADAVRKDGVKKVVLLGMGGSSLAAQVFGLIFGNGAGYPSLQVLDTTDPVSINRLATSLDWEKTLFLVSSKSGTTLETICLFKYFYNMLQQKLKDAAKNHFIFITDFGSSMEDIGNRLALRHVFLNNTAIGGRYSALSLPGIVPAALTGVNIERLLQNAASAAVTEKEALKSNERDQSGFCLGLALGTLAKNGRDKLSFILPASWEPFGAWLEQLIAESTGKKGRGILPVINEDIKDIDRLRPDRCFVVFQLKNQIDDEKINTLTKAGHPVITITVADNYDLGGQMFFWEIATACAGYVLGINPFDQPDVESSKVLTKKMIVLYREKKELPQKPECGKTQNISALTSMQNQLAKAEAISYVSLQVYIAPSDVVESALKKLQAAITFRYGLAVTTGYSPRYLHSTGQLHKGDAGRGLFIQLTADGAVDLPIPDDIASSSSSLSFGALKAAQALGDSQALSNLGRKVICFHLGNNPAESIKDIIEALTENGKRK